MRAVRQLVTVPASRELRIQLPEEAAPHEEAEVIVLFKLTPCSAKRWSKLCASNWGSTRRGSAEACFERGA